MTDNGLETKVTEATFMSKPDSEKLNILYRVMLAQQHMCKTVTGIYNGRLDKLEIDRKVDKAKLFGIGAGSGGGAAALYSVFKSWFTGG